MRHIAVISLLLLWLAPTVGFAQNLRFATDASAPVTAKADKIIWQQAIGRADLSGAAHITQGPLSITAEAMHLLMDETGEAQNLVSQGQVVVLSKMGASAKDGIRRADADRADYDLNANVLLLSGNVRVRQNNAQQGANVRAARLTIDMQTGLAHILGSPKNGKPARARIELE